MLASDTELLARTAVETRSETVLTPTITGGKLKPIFVPLKNEPGVQCRIEKAQLHIDPAYQRKLNEKQVARYVANWSWVSCGVLKVSRRLGSELYFVVDGQHRYRAASHLPRITELPCIVFELDTVKDEAIAFLAANVERRMPTINDQFKALIMAGDPIAEAMFKLADTYSRQITIDAAPGARIVCVRTFANLMRQNRAALERVFPVLCELARGQSITAKLMTAFHHLERCMPRGESLSDERWHRRIVSDRVGYTAVIEQIRQMSRVDPHGHSRAYATGLLRAINHGLRQPLMISNIEQPRR